MALPVEAAGNATNLIIFTDKQVYQDEAYEIDTFTVVDGDNIQNLGVIVYAAVIDDDGNIITTGLGFSGILEDVELQDHQASTIVHHTITNNPTGYGYDDIALSAFADNGVNPDAVGGDGIFTSYIDVVELPASIVQQHLLINITVSESTSGFSEVSQVLFTRGGCYHSNKEITLAAAHGKHLGGSSASTACVICHWGYEHSLGNHKTKITPPVVPSFGGGYNWNYLTGDDTGPATSTLAWSELGDSDYCYACHWAGSTGNAVWDYMDGVSTDRPSCNVGTSVGGSTCHAVTVLEGVSLANVDWTWKSSGAGYVMSHNHTNALQGTVPCELCHKDRHNVILPNSSAVTVNDQCTICHSNTGPSNSNHGESTTDCKSCHLDDSQALDSHLVPAAGIPNANCSECHDMGGKAPYHVDYNTMNNSDYVHFDLNNLSNTGSATRPTEDRMCWACHGEDDNSDGKADFSEQPNSSHSSNYNIANAHNCTYCHNNTNSNTSFGAPQNKAHTWYDDEINTPAVTGCEDCHAEAEMYNTSHVDDDHVTRIGLSVHYGTGHAYLENAQHTSAYCKYCHMNTSTTFSDAFSNPENMQRSEHSSLATTPGCTVSQCHNAYALHGDDMTEPTYTDDSCSNETACHDSTFNNHNGNVTCMECHMNNSQTNIHPIKYLQLDGVTFSSSSVTAAPCVTCHQGNAADAIMAQWNHTPHKVEHQHHSEDPANGSKWNRTGEDAYWDYVPDVFTFPTSWIRNEMNDSTNTNSTIANFASMTATNESATRIQETSGGAYSGDQPNNHDFPNDTHQNWNFSGVKTGVTMGWDGVEGNPAGSVYVQATGRNVAATGYWNGSFYYANSKTIAYASIQLDSRMLTLQGAGATGDFTVYIDNGTALTEVYSRTYTVTETEWVEMEPVEIIGASQLFNVDSNYEVVIKSNLVCANLKTTEVKVGYDNVHVIIKEEDFQLYNYTFNIDNVPNGVNYDYELYVGYQAHIEPASLYMYNNSTSNFEYKATLDEGSFTKVKVDNINFSYGNYNDGNVKVRINDTDIGVDTDSDYFDIQYIFVHGYKPTNYPCEYCHSPNKHSINALGIPAEFAGLNTENQSINSTTNWCASCHYDGYVSNGGDYSDVILAFQNHSLPVPPEITGNATYGNMSNSSDGSQVYVDHSDYGMSDEDCFSCHKGGLEEGTRSTEFMHNVSTGTSGNRNCTECHTPIATSYAQIDYNAVATGMHATLKNDTANPDNTTNPTNPIELICWTCHGDGLYLKPGDHYTKPAKVCEDCHITGKTDYLATNVSDHIWTGEYGSTDVLITASSTVSDCAGCHNNSINTSFVDNTPDTDTASASHYGVNNTADLLMSAGSSSIDCLYCHRNVDKGIEADWGVNSSTTIDLDTKGEPHTSYLLADCYDCHGGTPTDFHEAVMDPGAGAGPNCIGCHDIAGPQQNVNFNAMDQSDAAHKYLNNNTGTGLSIENEKCWACHNNGLQPANGTHGIGNYKDPYLCVDCHTSTGSQAGVYPTAWNVTEHVSNADELHTNQSFANVNDSCRSCHEDIAEMMISPSIVNDPDGASGNVYSGTHGGNESSSHYALKRSLGTGDAYCNYCHANASSSFQYNNSNNKLIYEHTSNVSSDVYNASMTCESCHLTGRIHNSTLTTPEASDWDAAGGEDKCAPCHLSSDPGSNLYVSNSMHNTSADIADCGVCHNSDAFATGGAYLSVHSDNLTAAPPAVADTCTECHTNTTWVSKEILEHTDDGGADINAAYMTCDNSSCHVSASAHSSSLVTPSASNWGATGAEDRCAPCHLNGDPGSTLNVLNSMHNTSADIVDCGVCHNSDAFATGGGYQDIHSSNLTAAPPAVADTCTECHTNTTWVSMEIREHTDDGTADINAAYMTCDNSSCHADASAHSSSLATPATTEWTSGQNDMCRPCHEPGYSNATMFVYDQAHNPPNGASGDITGCGYCHNATSQSPASFRIHDADMQETVPSYSTCVDCHNGTSTYVGTDVIYTHFPGAEAGKGNTSESGRDCEECHNLNVGDSMHASGMVSTPTDGCLECHEGLKTSPYNATTANATITHFEHDTTGGNDTSDCTWCHNNPNDPKPFHFTQFVKGTLVDPTGWPSWTAGDAANCIDCHMNNTAAPFYADQPPVDHDNNVDNATWDVDDCYNCHTTVESSSNPDASRELHFIDQAPASANCTECHDIGGEASYQVDVDAMNNSDSLHNNLNSIAADGGAVEPYATESKRCWACHGNGTAPSSHPVETKNPYVCEDCHTYNGSQYDKYTPAYVIDHIPEGYNTSTNVHTTDSCTVCHNNSIALTINDPNLRDADDIVAHYGTNSSLMTATNDSLDCKYCHMDNTNNVTWGNASYFTEHEGTTTSSPNSECYGCHNESDSVPLANLHSNETSPGVGAGPDCISCHDAPSGPKSYSLIDFSVSNASDAIHKMVNADVVSSYDSANYPCWGCHGNGTQPASGSHPTEYKTPFICQDCHVPGGSRYAWATTLATPAPSVQEHYTGANLSAASSANVTWSCLQCHQDSSGMVLSNSDTDTAMKSGWTDDGYDGNGGSNSSYHYGMKRTDMGSGDDYCNYCHNNANASNSFPYDDAHNKAIIEHTANTSADVYNVTTMTCGDCHSTGGIHDSSLTTPSASDWDAAGGVDKCAPCHLLNDLNSTLYVSNSMHNTSANIADCGVCHNSDAFATGGAYLSVHSDNLTAAPPAVADTCTECHTNTTWVSMEIREHTDDGGADINAAYMTCDNSSCHGSTSAHSSSLVPSSASGWSGASNSVCAPCHESSGSGSTMKVASHNTTTTGISDCAECHHDTTFGTSGAYQGIHSDNLTAGASASYDSCTECHTTDTTFVTNAVNTHYKGAAAGKGNTASFECEQCHNLGVGASMHASGMNIPSEGCNECHNDTGSTSYNSTILIQNLNHDNSTYNNTVTCDTCHNTTAEPANFHFSDYPNGTVEDTSWKTPGVLVNCIDCHTDNYEASPYYAEPTSYHKGIYGSAIDDCYDCHTTVATATDANAPEAMHNVTITGVWDDCISCHESETNGAPEIDTTQVSAGIHQNLNSGGNGACTACHGPAADHYTTARDCDFCHMNGTDSYSSRQVAEHYPSASDLPTYSSLADNDACIDCHNKTEMMLTYTDGTPGTDPAQVAHYGAKRADMGINDTYCNYCHNNASTVFTFENANNKVIMEHTTNGSADVNNTSMTCQSCHVNGRIHEAALTTPTVTEWNTSQGDYCAPCHEAGDSNATMYVYDQAHNPGNAESGNITGCGYCHNSTQSSGVRVHDADLQATVPGNSTCVGCHNATTAYVGADDQILSHMPNGGQYIGNTSTSGYGNCEDCHNISVGASMHSSGLNNPVITDCTDCHINGSLSPFNSTTKVVVMSDYNHTYINETTPSCNISLCHNASGNSRFHMDAYAAADIGDPGAGWENRSDAGFSGPLVDCIDCHETHNGTAPFDAPWVEAGETGADLEDHTSKTYSIGSCYVCHTNRTDASDRYMVHNVSIEPLSGGPDCLNCHNTSSIGKSVDDSLLDEANLTGTTHEMLNRANGSVSQDATCWACHGNGAEPGKHPENYKDPYTCEDCHLSSGSITDKYVNSTDIYKHYQGAVWELSKGKMAVGCSVCHDNSGFVTYLSPNNMSISYNAAHYGTNDSTDVSTCITGCHIDETINVQYGAILNNKSVIYGSLLGDCSYCHNATRNDYGGAAWAEPNLHLQTIDVYPRCFDGGIYGADPVCHAPIVASRRRR